MTFFDWIIKYISEYWSNFLIGAGQTMLIAVSGTVIGFLIGLAVALVKTIPLGNNKSSARYVLLKAVHFILNIYIEVMRGTPMMVQALIIHWSLFDKIGMPAILSGIIIIFINTGAYMAEIVRGGIISVDNGQFEGASALGMSHFQLMTRVILPQAIRNIMPSVGNEFVVNIKDSSVLMVISVTELLFLSKKAGGTYLQFVPAYVIAAAIYFVLTFSVTRILRLVEKKMDGSDNYVIFGSQSSSAAEIRVGKED